MPVRNTVKQYDAPAYYHVYNRGANGQVIFLDRQDYQRFLTLLARYTTDDTETDSRAEEYTTYNARINCYCLMPNHFHLLVYQPEDPHALSQLMKSVATAYSMYFNHKYKHQGRVFQSVFKASRIDDEGYLLHITRYIHMNPRSYLRYDWSSLRQFLGKPSPSWLDVEPVRTMSSASYRDFLESYEGRKAELELLKNQLAG